MEQRNPIFLTEEGKRFLEKLRGRNGRRVRRLLSTGSEMFEKILKPEGDEDKRQPGFGLPPQIALFRREKGGEIQILRVVIPADREQSLECDVLTVSKAVKLHEKTVFWPSYKPLPR